MIFVPKYIVNYLYQEKSTELEVPMPLDDTILHVCDNQNEAVPIQQLDLYPLSL